MSALLTTLPHPSVTIRLPTPVALDDPPVKRPELPPTNRTPILVRVSETNQDSRQYHANPIGHLSCPNPSLTPNVKHKEPCGTTVPNALTNHPDLPVQPIGHLHKNLRTAIMRSSFASGDLTQKGLSVETDKQNRVSDVATWLCQSRKVEYWIERVSPAETQQKATPSSVTTVAQA